MRGVFLDASGDEGVIALFNDEKAVHTAFFPAGHSSRDLAPLLQATLKKEGWQTSSLQCMAVGIGPGSYTGMRSAVAVAQAIAFAHAIPTIGLCSLKGYFALEEGPFAVLTDARIGGVYWLEGNVKEGRVSFLEPKILSLEQVAANWLHIERLVSPQPALKERLGAISGSENKKWQVTSFNPKMLIAEAYLSYQRGENILAKEPKLLYLRPTQAERELEMRGN